MAENPMKEITIEKLIINCCVGESGDRLSRAVKVLTEIAGMFGLFLFTICHFMLLETIHSMVDHLCFIHHFHHTIFFNIGLK
jgi:hypothetical protein